MIIGRFAVRAAPGKADEVAAAIAAVEAPSLAIPGVLHFDTARSLTDPDVFVVLEVFEHREAFDRQNAQPEVAAVLGLVDAGAVVGGYAWTTWETG